MAGSPAILLIKIIADASKARGEIDKVSGRMNKFKAGMAKLALPAAAVAGAITGLAVAAGKAASDLQQSEGAVESVFGKHSQQVIKWADQAAEALGLSATDYENLASVVGSQLKNMGTSMDKLAPKTDALIKLGSDLSATYGGTTSDAVEAISALLRGERDPIERYGVSIKQATIDAWEMAHGLKQLVPPTEKVAKAHGKSADAAAKAAPKYKKLTGQAKTNADAQATLAILTQQTADAQGQFARESDTAAGSQQRMAAEMENTKAQLGQALLPAMSAFARILGTVAQWVQKNRTLVLAVTAAVFGMAVAILAVNAALFLLSLSPAVLLVYAIAAAVAALVVGLVLAYNKVGWFRAFVQAAFALVGRAVQTVIGWIRLVPSALTAMARIAGVAINRVRAWLSPLNPLFAAIGRLAVAIGRAMRFAWSLILPVLRLIVSILKATLVPALRLVGTVLKAVLVPAFHILSVVIKSVLGWAIKGVIGLFKLFGKSVLAIIQGVTDTINAMADAVNFVVDALKHVVEWIKKIHFPKPPKWLSKLNPLGAVVPSLAPAPAVPMTRGLGGTVGATTGSATTGQPIQIFALDPQQTARLVQRLVHTADVRAGRKRFA